MTLSDSPLRLLVKTYASGLLNRDQYLDIRQELLKKLSTHGEISHEDLQNFLSIHMDTRQPSTVTSYSVSDWIIIVLGLIAATVMGFVLYG